MSEAVAVLRDLTNDVGALREMLRGMSVGELREVSDRARLLQQESETLLL